jgi:hypothetical protein
MATLKALDNHIILKTIFGYSEYLYDCLLVNKRWHEVALSLLLQDRKIEIYCKIDSIREEIKWKKKYNYYDILPDQSFIKDQFYSKPTIHILLDLWCILTLIPNQLKKQIFPDFLELQHEYEECAYQNFWDRNLSKYDVCKY